GRLAGGVTGGQGGGWEKAARASRFWHCTRSAFAHAVSPTARAKADLTRRINGNLAAAFAHPTRLRTGLSTRYHCDMLIPLRTAWTLHKNCSRGGDARMRTTVSTTIMTCIALSAVTSARAAGVHYERRLNREPQNWLMNHHDDSAQRYSTLTAINKANVKGLRPVFAVALGGASGNENLTATPLVDDGFMYVTDAWGVVYKIDVRSGRQGDIVWK